MTQPTWIGKTLGGRYLIESELGHGGMSAVYKATDSNLRRVVAIKLIHSHLSSNPEFVRRFEAEATAVAQLRHPHIIQVHDYNNDGGTYYIVLEFVPGETLQQRLKRLNDAGRQMGLDEVLNIATSIGDALTYAHQRGLVHRDIKPANVMINVNDEAILTDFGIVKIVGGTQHTATGAVMGTARYMSPEQIKGLKVDAAADIYSFGVMLYEMVSGRVPFNAESVMTVMMMHVKDPVPDVRTYRPDVPPMLIAIINRALAKEPAQRYQSMAELVADLRRVQSGAGSQPQAAVGVTGAMTMLDADLTEMLEEDMIQTPPPPPPPLRQPSQSMPQPTSQPTPQRTPSTPQVQMAAAQPKGNRNLFIGLGVVGVLAIAAVLFFVFRPSGGDGGDVVETPIAEVTDAPEETAVPANIPPDDTPTSPPPTATLEPTATDVPPTATLAPTATAVPPTATLEPTATSVPPTATNPPLPTATAVTQLSVRINSISLDGSTYVVNYETFGYTETLPGTHIHFFFNTVPPEQAGLPGSGPWILYGGPRPFNGYTTDKRGSATQMCALVANPDHTVIANSGNCVNLP
ncbi:MAG: serine/threonine protein kinase [Ardenticatenaceae bacterium]|nr:serine/threonine protein kinase [Ardenticatenaceae bacterium]MCB9446600.1 serine/threonine protein kinase [Ardenticatenaceae bacterium]